ncbi:MAG: hypothetical protein H0V94_10345 [Actinobacteria bacterium]|nr:hypothetical protein [Actinomycetota bacterium]
MFDSVVVDVAFGLIFVFVILSLACSALNETISSIFNWRAEFLRQGIANLLEPANLDRGLEHTGKLLEHPLLNALVRPMGPRSKRRRYPSYVPSRTFVAALLDFDRAGAGRNVEEAIAAVPSEDARRALAVLYERADGDVTRFTRDAERWFDDSMERVSGWYRRRVQKMLWVLALALVVSLNVDSLRIAEQLWTQKAVRAAVVARAEAVRPAAGSSSVRAIARDVTELDQLAIPIGWTAESRPDGKGEWLLRIVVKILGLLLTAAALTLGAPFWFDVLSKVARLRSAGAPPPATDAVRRGEGEETRAGPGAAGLASAPEVKG